MLRDSAAGRRADENVFLPIVTLLNRWEFYSGFFFFFFLPLCCARLGFMTPWHAGIGSGWWHLLPHPSVCCLTHAACPVLFLCAQGQMKPEGLSGTCSLRTWVDEPLLRPGTLHTSRWAPSGSCSNRAPWQPRLRSYHGDIVINQSALVCFLLLW